MWTYAVMAAAYTRNRCYNPRTGKTPFELFVGKKPNINSMHVFGTVCYSYVQNKTKLDPRSKRGIFVGYDRGSPAYLVYFGDTGDVKKIRCVKFTETYDDFDNSHDVDDYVENPDDNSIENEPVVNNPVIQREDEPVVNNPAIEIEAPGAEDAPRYPPRERTQPKYLQDYVVEQDDDHANDDDLVAVTVDFCYKISDVPVTYREAVISPNSQKWKNAMEDEIRALGENNTFELTTLPKGRTTVGGRWVYAIKLGPDGKEQYKARYVAKGYSQVADIDYHETFSPTARITSVRMLMQLGVEHDLVIHQMDVKTAYLNAPIDCELYIEQPEGFVTQSEGGKTLVCKLKKSLYGLKQSGRNWNNMLHSFLINENFVQSLADPCVYTRFEKKSKIILIVWVDDIIIAANSNLVLEVIKGSLCRKFKMKDLGELSWFLGIQFVCKPGQIEMNQSMYLEKVLTKFNMMDCKPKTIPCDIGLDKAKDVSPKLVDGRPYREIVGSLIYAMSATRPDLCYVVTKLSQEMSKPTTTHLNLARHVLRYLKGTIHYNLRFTKSKGGLSIKGCCDADWGGSNDRRSLTGYGFQICTGGPLVSWKCKKQQTVALSTCEAEYMSLSAAVQEAKFLIQLFKDMNMYMNDTSETVILYVDNQGAIALAKNPVHHQRSKHIDIKYHYVRSEVQRGFIKLEYIQSEDNIADIFTKPVSKIKMSRFMCDLMGTV